MRSFTDHQDTVELRASEVAGIRLPLNLTEVVQVDSKTRPAVQLADVMVGAALEAVNTLGGRRSGGLDPKDLIPLYAEQLDFAEQRRRFRHGVTRRGDHRPFRGELRRKGPAPAW